MNLRDLRELRAREGPAPIWLRPLEPFLTVDVAHASADFRETTDGDVPWYDRIWNTGKPAMPQVHIGTADFGVARVQQRRTGLQVGLGEFAEFNRNVCPGKDGGEVGSHL